MTATYTYFGTATIPDASGVGILIITPVNRVRRVHIDAANAAIGTAGGNCVKPVNPIAGNTFDLGPGQSLYARSTTQTANIVSYTLEDQTNEGINTDEGTQVTPVAPKPARKSTGVERPGVRRAR